MANTDIDKTVSSNAVRSGREFTFSKTKGKGDDATVVATFILTGLKLKPVGDSWKIDPQDSGNIATIKALIGDFPQFAGAMFNTYLPVFLRGKLNDGFRGTLRQAVETACSGKVAVVRSPQFQVISGILVATPAFDPKAFPKTAWGPMGFGTPPTDAEVDAVRNGKDPWSDDDNDE